MKKIYEELLAAEKKRSNLAAAGFLILPFCFVLVALLIPSIAGAIVGVLVGLVCSFYLSLQLRNSVDLVCPICNSDNISEDFSNSVRYSVEGVKHRCEDCQSIFVDGALEENDG